MVTPVVEISNLVYTYADGTEALRGVDFRLMPGETVALLGANGSGKTTLVLHLNGLLRGQGEVTICGIPVTDKSLKTVRQKVGLVFQDSDTQLFMPTVLEDVAFGPLNMGYDAPTATERARRALDQVAIGHLAAKAPYHLSAGEKKRAAIAGILAMDCELLVLDEPTTFLDPTGQQSLLELLKELPQAKLIVTHDLDFARALADRAVFFEAGKIAAEGTVEGMVERFFWGKRSDSRADRTPR